MKTAPYLQCVSLKPAPERDNSLFPFNLPFVQNLDLTFESPVTFLVGENGCGKSTLIEGIVERCNQMRIAACRSATFPFEFLRLLGNSLLQPDSRSQTPMKSLTASPTPHNAVLVLLALVLAQTPAPAAQTLPSLAGNPLSLLPGAGDITKRAPFLAAAFSEFFSDSRNFTARAELSLPGRNPGDSIPIGLAMSEGRMRWQLNTAQVRSAHLPPERVALLKQMKMDSVILYLQPDTHLIAAFPRMKAWVETPMPKATNIQENAQAKIGGMKKTPVAKEIVDGHPCIKYRLTVPEDSDPNQVAVTWEATDLNDLPIKIMVKTDGQVYGIQLRNIRPGKTDERLFQPPPGYTKRASFSSLLQEGLLQNVANSGQAGGSVSLESLLSPGQ